MTTTATAISRNLDQVTMGDLKSAMLTGTPLCLRGPRGSITGWVNAIEHEDGSGHKFNLRMSLTDSSTKEVFVATKDQPKSFGMKPGFSGPVMAFTTDAPSRDEIFQSFFTGQPLVGKVSIKGVHVVVADVVKKIEREDGSGHSFNLQIGGAPAYLRTRD